MHVIQFYFCRDTICDLDGASELANYGEYSGAPSEQQTYEYAKTLLQLMTEQKHPEGIHQQKCNGPFPKRQILDSSKLKELADYNFKFDENCWKFSKW